MRPQNTKQKSAIDAIKSTAARRSPGKWTVAMLLAAVGFSHIYYGYRYAFQINSTDTSPTYSDTPIALQVGRYVGGLILSAVAWYAWFVEGYQTSLIRRAIAVTLSTFVASLIVVAPAMAGGVAGLAAGGSVLKAVYVLPMAFSFLLLPSDKNSMRRVLRWMITVPFLYHSVYSAIQYYLYYSEGRLPALGYSGGLVRFGGGWDDPNAFGMYCGFVIAWAILGIETEKKFAKNIMLMTLAAAQLAMTFSYSSFIAIAVMLVALFLWLRTARARISIIYLLAGLALLAYFNWETLLDVKDQKMDSAYSRVDQLMSLSSFFNQDIVTVLVGARGGVVYSENMYQLVLVNFGLLGASGLAILLFLTAKWFWGLLAAARSDRLDSESVQVVSLACAVAVLMGVGCMGIPYMSVFPVNYFFWILIALAIHAKTFGGYRVGPVSVTQTAGRR